MVGGDVMFGYILGIVTGAIVCGIIRAVLDERKKDDV